MSRVYLKLKMMNAFEINILTNEELLCEILNGDIILQIFTYQKILKFITIISQINFDYIGMGCVLPRIEFNGPNH